MLYSKIEFKYTLLSLPKKLITSSEYHKNLIVDFNALSIKKYLNEVVGNSTGTELHEVGVWNVYFRPFYKSRVPISHAIML